jgi:hypothetical protein
MIVMPSLGKRHVFVGGDVGKTRQVAAMHADDILQARFENLSNRMPGLPQRTVSGEPPKEWISRRWQVATELRGESSMF